MIDRLEEIAEASWSKALTLFTSPQVCKSKFAQKLRIFLLLIIFFFFFIQYLYKIIIVTDIALYHYHFFGDSFTFNIFYKLHSISFSDLMKKSVNRIRAFFLVFFSFNQTIISIQAASSISRLGKVTNL